MNKKCNKYQKFSKINEETDSDELDIYPPVKHKGHGNQKKTNRQAKKLRQDIEYISAVVDVRHAA